MAIETVTSATEREPGGTAVDREKHNVCMAGQILEILTHTPYSCSLAQQLRGGALNFIYRGILSRPLEDGSKSVIIKHAEEYGFTTLEENVATGRCVIEQAVLHELQGTSFESASEDNITVRPPRLYHFSDRTNSLVIEDFPRSVRMVDYLTSMHQTGPSLPAFSIGHAVGSWLRCFHFSKSCKASPDLLAVINSNGSMQDTVFNFYYRNLTQKCERYLEGSQERMKEYAVAEFRTNADVIHGDFSTRNFLMSYPAPATGTEVMIIDWETCQRGSRSQDLGRLISDLYVLQHFKVVDTDKILHGLTEGYHVLNREMAFHTAIHVGIHLFSWDTIMSTYTKEQAVSLAKFARDLIVKGWEMDQGWLEGTFLKILFQA